MLAGVRDVAVGATILMAGLLAVMVVGCVRIGLFLPDISVVTFVLTPWWGLDEPWIYTRALVPGNLFPRSKNRGHR